MLSTPVPPRLHDGVSPIRSGVRQTARMANHGVFAGVFGQPLATNGPGARKIRSNL